MKRAALGSWEVREGYGEIPYRLIFVNVTRKHYTGRRPQKCGHYFMSRPRRDEPRIYHNKELMNELNEFFSVLKIHLYKDEIPSLSALRWHRPKPTIEYMDDLFHRVYAELEKDSEPMRKY